MHNDRHHWFRLDYLSLILLLLPLHCNAYQNLAVATGQNDFYYDAPKNQTFARFAANDPIYNPGNQTVTSTRPYNVVGMDGKTYQATITRSAPADIPKVGSALSKFAQRVGPLAMGIATVDLICSLSNICKSLAGLWEIPADPQVSGYPSSLPTVGHYRVAGIEAYKYPAPDIGCSNAASKDKFWGEGYTGVGSGVGASACAVTKTSTGVTNYSAIDYVSGTCPTNYTVSGSTCVLSGNPDGIAPTAQDWTNAEPALSTPSGAERLAAELEPLPISVPSAYTPVQLPIGKITTTTRDAVGVSTGTQTVEKRLQIEDAATLTEPDRATVTEVSTTTNYDLNNNPTSSTETVSEPQKQEEPQPVPVEFPDYQTEFDTVTDSDLPTQAFQSDFTPTPWGSSGSCPADLVYPVRNTSLTIKTAPICDAAETLRPLILLLASLSAAGIALGVRTTSESN